MLSPRAPAVVQGGGGRGGGLPGIQRTRDGADEIKKKKKKALSHLKNAEVIQLFIKILFWKMSLWISEANVDVLGRILMRNF